MSSFPCPGWALSPMGRSRPAVLDTVEAPPSTLVLEGAGVWVDAGYAIAAMTTAATRLPTKW
jgi:hypothetical protein